MAQMVKSNNPVDFVASSVTIEESTRKTNTTPKAANQFVVDSEESNLVPQKVALTPTTNASPGFVGAAVDNDSVRRHQPSDGSDKQIKETVTPSRANIQNQDKKAPRSRAKKDRKCFVQHNYHDHAFFTPEDVNIMLRNDQYEGENQLFCSRKKRVRHGPKGGVTIPFPLRLHEMLDKIEADGHGDIISWQPHGRCFLVHNPVKFVNSVMPTYFRQTKLTSFQRQLNLYGFSRLTSGLDKNGYYHELFLRGKPYLARLMSRTRIKGTGTKAASSPSTEPDFYAMNRILPDGRPAVRVCASVPISMRTGFRQAPMMVQSPYPPSAHAYRTKMEKVPSRPNVDGKSSNKMSSKSSPPPVIKPEQQQNTSSPNLCPRTPAAVTVTPIPTKPPCIPMTSCLAPTNKRHTAIAPPPLFTKPVAEQKNHQTPPHISTQTTAAMVTPTAKRHTAPCPVSPIALPPSLPQLSSSSPPPLFCPNQSNPRYKLQPQQERGNAPPSKIEQQEESPTKSNSLPSKSISATTVATKTIAKVEQRKDENESHKLERDNKQTGCGEPAEPNEEIMFEGKRFHYIDSLSECPSTIVPFNENEATPTDPVTPISSPQIVRQVSRLGDDQRRLSEDSFEDKYDTKISPAAEGMDWYTQRSLHHPIYQKTMDECHQNSIDEVLTPSSSSSSLYDIVGYPDMPTSSIEDEESLFDSAHEEENDEDFGYFLEAMIH